MRKKELAPTLRFKGFTDAWKQSSLNENVSYITSTLSISDARKKGKYPLFDANNTIGFCSDKFVNQDYITIIKDGAGVGRVRLLPKYSYFIGTMGAMVPKNSDVNFDYALLEKTNFSNHIRGTTIPHIYFSDYGNMEIKICSLQEQTLIGNVFSSLDSLITLHQRKYEELQNAKKSLLQKMFPEGNNDKPSLRFKGFTDAWEQRKFSEEVNLSRGLTYHPGDISKDGIRVLRSSNILDDAFVINEDDVFVLKSAINIDYAKNGDILITSANGSNRLVGKHTIISNVSEKSAVHGGFMLLGRTRNSYFINASMSSSWYKKFIDLYVSGGNGAIGNLNKSDLDDYSFMVPPIREQDSIGTLFKLLDTLITLHQRKCEKLQNIKKSLLERMFI